MTFHRSLQFKVPLLSLVVVLLLLSLTPEHALAGTMIPGWPDALRCGDDSNKGYILLISSGGLDGAIYFLAYNGSGYRTTRISFDAQRQYIERVGFPGATGGCYNKSIQELYAEGRAFNFVESTKPDPWYRSTSIRTGLPDAVRCNNSGHYDIFYGETIPARAGIPIGSHFYRPSGSTTQENWVILASEINVPRSAGTGLNCRSRSKTEDWYLKGDAFHFVNSLEADPSGNSSMYPNIPDAIICSSMILILNYGPDGTNNITYTSIGISGYSATFDSTGNFLSSTIYLCSLSKLSELYLTNAAFNFVNGKIWNHTPLSTSFNRTISCVGLIDFTPYIISQVQGNSQLKIILDTLPTNGVLFDSSSNQNATTNQTYQSNALQYRVNNCTQATMDSFDYSVIDSLTEAQSNSSVVFILNHPQSEVNQLNFNEFVCVEKTRVIPDGFIICAENKTCKDSSGGQSQIVWLIVGISSLVVIFIVFVGAVGIKTLINRRGSDRSDLELIPAASLNQEF